jgi:hypothetical protein
MERFWGRLHIFSAAAPSILTPETSYGLRNDVGVAEDRAGLVYSIGQSMITSSPLRRTNDESNSTENSLDNAYRVINGQNRDVHINNPAEKVYRRK